jgi:aminoglycoside 6'-N-acetyltransferase
MTVPVLRAARLTLRPLSAGDLAALEAILRAPGVREWWGLPSPDERSGLANDGAAFAVEAEGELAGWLAFSEENDPDYRHAGLDIVLAPRFQGRGLGPEALRAAIRWLAERGHHRVTIDPAAANERAIRAYRSVGFRPVGIMRAYERGPDGAWRDGLLMQLLVAELVEAPGG